MVTLTLKVVLPSRGRGWWPPTGGSKRAANFRQSLLSCLEKYERVTSKHRAPRHHHVAGLISLGGTALSLSPAGNPSMPCVPKTEPQQPEVSGVESNRQCPEAARFLEGDRRENFGV